VEKKDADFRQRQQKVTNYAGIVLSMWLHGNLGENGGSASLTAIEDNTLRWYKLVSHQKSF